MCIRDSNIIDKNFLREVNKTFDTDEFDAMTTYRNSKNFDENWLTAAYSIWFMHEARHLNYPRMLLGAQCMILSLIHISILIYTKSGRIVSNSVEESK